MYEWGANKIRDIWKSSQECVCVCLCRSARYIFVYIFATPRAGFVDTRPGAPRLGRGHPEAVPAHRVYRQDASGTPLNIGLGELLDK